MGVAVVVVGWCCWEWALCAVSTGSKGGYWAPGPPEGKMWQRRGPVLLMSAVDVSSTVETLAPNSWDFANMQSLVLAGRDTCPWYLCSPPCSWTHAYSLRAAQHRPRKHIPWSGQLLWSQLPPAAVACPHCSLLPLWRSQPPVVILAPRALSACIAVLHHQMHAVAGWQKLTHIPKSITGASLKHPASSARGGLPLLWSGVWGEGVLSREKPGGESESLQEMETISEQRETPPTLVCGALQELSNVLFLLLCISVEAWEMEVVTMPRSCPETSSRTKVRSPHLVKINMLTGAPETLQNSPLQPLCHSFYRDATSSHSCSCTLCSQGP